MLNLDQSHIKHFDINLSNPILHSNNIIIKGDTLLVDWGLYYACYGISNMTEVRCIKVNLSNNKKLELR